MGKPLFKASDGGQIDILGGREDVTQSELPQGSGTWELIPKKDRPESFPTGSPMSISPVFLQYLGNPSPENFQSLNRSSVKPLTYYQEFTLVDYLCYPFDCRV